MFSTLDHNLIRHDWEQISRLSYPEDGMKKATLLSYLLTGKAPWTFVWFLCGLFAVDSAKWPYASPSVWYSLIGAMAFMMSWLSRGVFENDLHIIYSKRRPDKDGIALAILIVVAMATFAVAHDFRMALLFPFQYLFAIAIAWTLLDIHDLWWRALGIATAGVLLLAAYAAF